MHYCDFEDTNEQFNNKTIYKCKYCGSLIALENPDAKILCFKKQQDFFQQMYNMDQAPENMITNHHMKKEDLLAFVKNDALNQASMPPQDPTMTQNMSKSQAAETLCSKEEIDQRMSICSSCEHFKDNACLLCGCVVVREANFNNKLAHRNQSCPINKWGPIQSKSLTEESNHTV
jgi:hypothetical protein